MEKLESYGFRVICLVTDNLSVNVKMFHLLNDGISFPIVPHPVDAVAASARLPCIFRPLFLSFDPCHVIKNVRNQFIDRIFVPEPGKMESFQPIRKTFENQQANRMLVKQVRFLTRIHVSPKNLEKQKVKPAIDIFKPEVIAAILVNSENSMEGFEDVHATVEFLELSINGLTSMMFATRQKAFESEWKTRYLLRLSTTIVSNAFTTTFCPTSTIGKLI